MDVRFERNLDGEDTFQRDLKSKFSSKSSRYGKA